MSHLNHLPKIIAKVIPHNKHRYDTCGDYFKRWGNLQVRVSKMKAEYEFAVLIHELIEWFLIQRNGIMIKEIDAFDMAFKGDEPGDDPQAPYHKEHVFATKIEKLIIKKFGINWKKYDKYITKL